MLLKVVPKNFAPVSNSSTIWNCAVDIVASFCPALASKSSTEPEPGVGLGSAVDVESDPHAAPTNRTPKANTVRARLRRDVADRFIH